VRGERAPGRALGRLIEVGSGRGPTGRRDPLSRYSDLFRRPSFGAFLSIGALQFAAPTTVLVVLLYAVTFAYPSSERVAYGAIALAFLGLSSAIPTLGAAFFSGALADRHDRGRLMRVVNLVSLLGVTATAADLIVAPATHLSVPVSSGFYLPEWVLLVYPCWATVVASSTVFRPAYNTSIPRFVETRDLGRANGVIYATAALLSAAGSLAVGAILTYAPEAYALALSFLLFFSTQAILLTLDTDLSVKRTAPVRSVAREAVDGFVYLGHRRELLEITIAALVVNFLSAVALVELGLYVASWLSLAEGIWYGAMVTASMLGVAVGYVLISRFRFEPNAGRVIMVLTLGMGVALLGLGLVRTVWLALPIVFVYSMLPGMITTVFLSTVQATVPDAMMGRVFSADEVGSYALVPVGQSAGGALTVAIGVQGTYLAAGGTIVFFGLLMVTSFAALRRLGFQAQESEPAAAAAVF
jgi:MFS transporter, DHA1 family, staphyloferrin A biosynthesis exporter